MFVNSPMKQLVIAERASLGGHIVAMAFGLCGLLLVLPNPEFIADLPPFGLELFALSMNQGGVSYIILGAIAIALFLNRTLGPKRWLTFMVPAVALSLSSELLGTSTGFPFGAYHYLTGLGHKVAGLVPFTIPLSWFYMGAVCYVIARNGLEKLGLRGWLRGVTAIALGAVFLTSWDLVLDPAMSQTSFPFWEFEEIGEFFGMPYRNLTGWWGTGVVFMGIASLFWGGETLNLKRSQLTIPLLTYVVNFAFGAVITVVSLDPGFWIPTALSVLTGVVPVTLCWWISGEDRDAVQEEMAIDEGSDPALKSEASVASLPRARHYQISSHSQPKNQQQSFRSR